MYKSSYTRGNNNGDVVVSDSLFPGAVVAIDHNRNHRFLYTGNPPGSEIMLTEICTDPLSRVNCKIKEQIQYI